MRLAIHTTFWPFRAAGWKESMTTDAERLLAEFGADAHEVAADRSWREDVGLLRTNHTGHWSRVTLEIERRLTLSEASAPAAAPCPVIH